MEMKQNLRLSQKQQLVMTLKLRQALKLLAMPTLELREEIRAELQTNPLLEEVDETYDSNEVSLEQKETEAKDAEPEVDWESYLQDASDSGSIPSPERFESELVRQDMAPVTLQEQLREQLSGFSSSDEDREVLDFILGSLDDRGFLTLSNEEIAHFTGSDLDYVSHLVSRLQECDPPGVGAGDLQESLLIQLKQKGEKGTLAYEIIEGYWEALTHRRTPEIAKALKVPVHDVQEALDDISHLTPNPGSEVAGAEAKYIYPDLVVERVDGEYEIALNDRNVPRLRINRAYGKVLLSKQTDNGETREFVKQKLNSARWIVQTIEQRRRTMVKVMKKIVEKQRGFFDHGVLYLKPMTLMDVAVEIDMHESTVSRVTNGKYVQTPRGVFELKYFFSSGLSSSQGEDVSSKVAREKIQRFVDGEAKGKPLSDQKLADRLKAEGVDIARRTVAKYREQMGVPSARLRRRH